MSLPVSAAGKSVENILLVRLGAMGDVIQTLPAAAELKRCFPQAALTWAIESRWAPLLHGNPHVDRVFEIPLNRLRKAKWSRAARREIAGCLSGLRQAKFDLAVDFQGLVKSAAVAFLSRAGRIYGFDRCRLREPFAAVFYSNRIEAGSKHVVDRYRELAAAVRGLRPAGAADFPLPSGETKAALPDDYVIASPHAGWGAKQWPFERYAALADLLWSRRRIPLLLDCAPRDEAAAASIARLAAPGAVVPHPSGIAALIAATRRASAVVGLDSGPLHLAAALGKPGVAIFGPTDPARNGPYGKSIEVLRSPDAETTYRRGKAPAAAMRAVAPQAVFEKLDRLLD